VDLGAGCGFQSIPLARLGYDVVAIDLDGQLLDEMMRHADGLRIRPIEDDLLRFRKHLTSEVELAICMTDTLLHLESRDDARQLIRSVFDALEDDGQLILTFRDLTHELTDLDRFIPVRSDLETLFTCFLEYEPGTVKVHDLVYRKVGDQWQFSKSFYRKLRLAQQWVADEAALAGFDDVRCHNQNGSVTLIATR
jgi:SAM-dependent methyltransferase